MADNNKSLAFVVYREMHDTVGPTKNGITQFPMHFFLFLRTKLRSVSSKFFPFIAINCTTNGLLDMSRRVCYIFVLCVVSIVMGGCHDDAGDLGIVYNTTGRSYSITISDTATLKMSTVLFDSIPTSGFGYMIFGKCNDPKLGIVDSRAYTQIDLGSPWNPTSDLVYDSMVMVMKYIDRTPRGLIPSYYFGDTTKTQTFEILPVTEDFSATNLSQFWRNELSSNFFLQTFYPSNAIFNKRRLSVNEAAPLATFSLRPRPTSSDSITIRISDTEGKRWFTEALRPDAGAFDNELNFIKFFKGFCIRSKATDADAPYLVGIPLSTFVIRMYFKTYVNGILTRSHRNFIYNPNVNFLSFNNFTADRSSTTLAALTPLKKELLSTQTNNETYVQAGIGIMTKITFPHILDVVNEPGFRLINSARLIVEPVLHSYDNKFLLPQALTLYYTDRSNIPLNVVSGDFGGGSQISYISVDSELNTNSAYIFNITQYVQTLITAGGPGQTQNSLFLTIPTNTLNPARGVYSQSYFSSLNRLCISNDRFSKFRTRLEIYYLTEK